MAFLAMTCVFRSANEPVTAVDRWNNAEIPKVVTTLRSIDIALVRSI